MNQDQFRPRLPIYLEDYIEQIKDIPEHELISRLTGPMSEKEKRLLVTPEDREEAIKILRDKRKNSSFKVPKPKKGKYKSYVVLGCLHIPFHNKAIFKAILNLIHDLRPTLGGIILNGDFLDLMSLSGHAKEDLILPGIDLGSEYLAGLEALLEIEEAIGKKKGVERQYIFGNHENRYYRFLKKFTNSKFGTALVSPQEGLLLDELGYNVIPDYNGGYIELGNDLQVHHGQYYGTHNSKKHLDMIPGKSTIYAHTHRVQSYTGPSGFTAWNTGCLIDLESPAFDYANRFTKSLWKNGFAVVTVLDSGESVVNPIQCINNGFFFGGKMY
jgi:hypothetical protein